MRPPLSLPLSELDARYDAVVVGSGYGGAIAACRLARAGHRVCILERGREYAAEDFPTSLAEAAGETQVRGRIRGRSVPVKNPLGLFDFRVHDDLNALVGCGLGGTSLINAGVFLEPDPRIWEDPVWPERLRADSAGVARGLARARAILDPRPWPSNERFPPSAKSSALEEVGAAIGAPFQRAPLLAHFAPAAENAAGVLEQPCNGCGNCVSGCRYEAKRTVDRNYLPDARNHGAHVFTEIAVQYVRKVAGGGWAVHFRPQAPDIEADLPSPFILAETVVLAAGVFGTSEILLRSRERGLPLSDALGTQFSGNGNLMGFARGGPAGGSQGRQHPGPGPCIVGALDVRGERVDDGVTVEDGVFPGAIDLLVAAGALVDELGTGSTGGLLGRVGARARTVAAAVAEQLVGAPRDVQLFLIQSHDGSHGRITLDDAGELSVSWPRYSAHARAEGIEAMLRRSPGLDASYRSLANPFGVGAAHVTVHPLGGCPMGDDHASGVVDDLCRVFDPDGGAPDGVHRGLYVCDASIVPRSLGTNPVATLCALVERACERMPERAKAAIGRAPAPSYPSRRATGASFSEAFTGWLSDGPRDPGGVDADGRATPLALPAELRLVITVDDVDGFLRDPRHPASAVGTFSSPLLSDEPLSVVRGKIALFSDDPAEQGTYYEVYDLCLVDDSGPRYTLRAMKKFHDGGPLRVFTDGTTLPIQVAGEGRQLQGVLTMFPGKLLSTIRTVTTHRARGLRDRLGAQLAFQSYFARRWFERIKLG